MKKELYKGRTKEEVKEILENEGSKGAHQFKEWNDVFDLLSECRRYDLPEIYAWSILSNRFEIKQKWVSDTGDEEWRLIPIEY